MWTSSFTPRQFAELHNQWKRARELGPHALGRILSLVESRGCETVVSEVRPTGEREFRHEQKTLRRADRWRDSGPKRATRLHFFRGRVPAAWAIEDHDARYLGYCDLRPKGYVRNGDEHEFGTISEAVIASDVFIPRDSRHLYLVCQRDFHVQLGERQLRVRGFPYIQQDNQVVRCAACALGTIARYFGHDRTAAHFEEMAERRTVPSLPRPGLKLEQIDACLKSIGLKPLLYDYAELRHPPDQTTPEQVVYRYIESGVPVLIGLDAGRNEMHTLVAIGYMFSPDSWIARARRTHFRRRRRRAGYQPSTQWVERFIVQDDNMGPYTLLPTSVVRRRTLLRPKAREPVIVVPLRRPLALKGETAERFVAHFINPATETFIRWFHQTIDQLTRDDPSAIPEDSLFWLRQFREHVKHGEVVLHTALRPAQQWRRRSLQSPNAATLAAVLHRLPVPEAVWVVELSWPSLFLHSRRACGQVVLDPDKPLNERRSRMGQAWLWMHLPGVVAYRNRTNGTIGLVPLPEPDYPLSHSTGADGSASNGAAASSLWVS
ncbi:MAG: hypothetical protein QOF78_3897 [Phycisphaerales bacterium]|jgi:hypothetical protein|nr:hypothetical protein [Phycisphaerales bacterium]